MIITYDFISEFVVVVISFIILWILSSLIFRLISLTY